MIHLVFYTVAVLLLAVGASCSSSQNDPIPQENSAPNTVRKLADSRQNSKAEALDGYLFEATSQTGWTTFRGGAGRTGRTSVKGPRKANLKWVFRTGGRIYGDVAVTAKNTIYVPSHDHTLYAIDANGRELWSYEAKGKIWTSPAIARDGTIYFGTDNDRLIALTPKGQLKWAFRTAKTPEDEISPKTDSQWDVDTSPAILADGTVVFGCDVDLYALRPSGMLRWFFKAGADGAKIFSSPSLGPNGAIYFGTQGNYLFALNQSAEVLWSRTTDGDNDATPAVGDDGTVYFGSDDGKLRAIGSDGTLKWERDLLAPIRAPLAIGRNGTVLASTYAKKPFLVAVDQRSGAERWRYAIEPSEGAFHGIQSGALVDGEGYIYFGGRDHYIYCLSPQGKLVWRYQTADQVDASPVLGPDGTLYVGSDDKRLYAFGRE